jgi:hypothetical protein
VIRDSKETRYVDVHGYFPYLEKAGCRSGLNGDFEDISWLPSSALLPLMTIRERDITSELDIEPIHA